MTQADVVAARPDKCPGMFKEEADRFGAAALNG